METRTVAQLYASLQQYHCDGTDHCHWCGSPCHRFHLHDDPPPIIGIRSKSGAKYPANAYMCWGCYLFRRERMTVEHLSKLQPPDKGYTDGQCPMNHSWFITTSGARIILKKDYPALWQLLLNPPLTFCLALLDPPANNFVHLFHLNEVMEIKAGTPLKFTINNILHSYTVHELEDALTSKTLDGKEPGVHALLRLLGPPISSSPSLSESPKVKPKGRPTEEEDPYKKSKKLIRASGM